MFKIGNLPFFDSQFENKTEILSEESTTNNYPNNSDTKQQNGYFITHNGLNEVIEEMPSKEEDNFKFSISFIDKIDSNVEMKDNDKEDDALIALSAVIER